MARRSDPRQAPLALSLLMAADRHEPACVKEKLMMMIGAAATPLCNERLGADEGSIACVAAEGVECDSRTWC